MGEKNNSDKLTAKQRMFAAQYIIDFHARDAAIRAGYSAKTASSAGSRMLKNVKIQKEIDRQTEIALGAQREQIRYRVLKELQNIAYLNAADYVTIETVEIEDKKTGKLLQTKIVKIKDTQKATGNVIASIKQNRFGTIEIKFHDKLKALELLGRYGSLFNDRLELTHKGKPIEIDDKSKLTEDEARDLFFKMQSEIEKDK